jgi:hypothetical protein
VTGWIPKSADAVATLGRMTPLRSADAQGERDVEPPYTEATCSNFAKRNPLKAEGSPLRLASCDATRLRRRMP